MGEKSIFYTDKREEWRSWLRANYKTETEIWFVFPAKDAEEPSLSYNDAVEEALCFGWIDSTAGKLDDKHGIRRFTPRREGSPYSRPNIERLIWLDKQGLLIPEIRQTVIRELTEEYVFPQDIIDELKDDELVWNNYQSFSDPYKRIRIAYIDAARKRPEEFSKRLKSFLNKTRENKLIVGYGGIEKYYK